MNGPSYKKEFMIPNMMILKFRPNGDSPESKKQNIQKFDDFIVRYFDIVKPKEA